MSNIESNRDEDLQTIAVPSTTDYHLVGRARAELERRRRKWEEEQATRREKFESTLFNAAGERDVKRKQFEEKLADRQMEHATALTDKQLETARSVARATRLAAWAAGLSALGAVVMAIMEVVRFMAGK